MADKQREGRNDGIDLEPCSENNQALAGCQARKVLVAAQFFILIF